MNKIEQCWSPMLNAFQEIGIPYINNEDNINEQTKFFALRVIMFQIIRISEKVCSNLTATRRNHKKLPNI